MEIPNFSGRARVSETMDGDQPPTDLMYAEYRFLRRLNTFGRTADYLLDEIHRRIPPGGDEVLQIMDFGSGGGDIPRHLMELADDRGMRLEAVASDVSGIAITYAAERAVGRYRVVQADVRAAEQAVPQGSCDVAHASLVLHHLSDQDVVVALRSMAGVARRLVVWNDLIRDSISVVGAWASTIVARRAIRRDAIASVRRSFTIAEARTAAEAAGLREIEVRRIMAGRFLLSGIPGPAPARRPTVRFHGLEAGYGPIRVLQGLSFVARAGELVEVRGPNGGGKSTLLNCVAGAMRPDKGKVWTDPTLGRIGFHPQEGGVILELDTAANVAMFGRMAGLRGQVLEAAVRSALDAWGLTSSAARQVSRLSIGLRRRVALAASLVHRPRLVVLDEPDAGLDAAGRTTLAQELKLVLLNGGTVLMATHTPDWVSRASPSPTVLELAG